MTTQAGIEKLLEKFWLVPKDQQAITCPYCGWRNMEPENEYDYITYHGEEPPKEYECPECGKIFMVEECVERWWDITKKEE